MSFRSSLGHDLNSSLESGFHECPIDRLGAFSKASRLGTLVWRLKWGNDPSVYHRTVRLLAIESRLNTVSGRKICELVLREWLDQNCRNCNGAKELIVGDLRITCPKCEGLGLKRHSDHARARFIGVSVDRWRKQARLLPRVLERLTMAERLVSATMHAELER